jgi:alpha-L-arabinofuranosidase
MRNAECRIIAAVAFVACVPWARAELPASASEVRVSVDAAHIVRTVDARLFGINVVMWDGLLDTPETVSALRELGVQALRWPGGSCADDYHWQFNRNGRNAWNWATSFAGFMHVATNLPAQVFITVNYGSGTAEEAAAWVRCANITNHCGFKYWEIGNENYGNWEHDENSPPHDPVTYARRTKEFFREMKAADPSIKIGVVVPMTWQERAGVLLDALKGMQLRTFVAKGYQGWTATMLATLAELGVRPDFVIGHRYPVCLSGWENDAALLQAAAKWTADAAALRRQLKTYFGTEHTNVELLCTENNSLGGDTGKQTTSLINGLYLADSFGQIAQTEFNSWLWWDLRNYPERKNNNSPALYGWREYGDHGIMCGNDTRYPTYYTFKLLKYFAHAGDRIARASSDNKLLSAYAARRADGTLSLLVINKSPVTGLKAGLTIAGFRPDAGATVYSYGVPQDEAARTGTGSPDIAQTSLSGAAGEFRREFPPYSASVIVFSPQRGPGSATDQPSAARPSPRTADSQ